MKTSSTTNGEFTINAMRGIAAILVLAGHARLMTIQDAGGINNLNIFQKVFYLLTTFGGSAVMVFFTISGYLVGGSVINGMKMGAFNAQNYISARVSRIYTVLVPALIVGSCIDYVGCSWLDWTSPYKNPHYGFMLPESIAADLNLKTFFGNLFLLQELFCNTIGTNHPLWSLSYEWWYYVVFPFIIYIFIGGNIINKFISIIILLIFIFTMPNIFFILGIVWLFGALTSQLPTRKYSLYTGFLSIAILIAFLILKSAGLMQNNIIIGICTCAVIFFNNDRQKFTVTKGLAFVGDWLSSISYSLYLFHMPFTVFIAAILVKNGDRFYPGLTGMMATALLILLAIIYSFVMWFLFERNTMICKKIIFRALSKLTILHK